MLHSLRIQYFFLGCFKQIELNKKQKQQSLLELLLNVNSDLQETWMVLIIMIHLVNYTLSSIPWINLWGDDI